MQASLYQKFSDLFSGYSPDETLLDKYWQEIEKQYSAKNRHYHNLSHIESMISELEAARNQIEDWDSLLFSVFYHDIVYKATAKDNEEKSPETAKTRLHQINLGQDKIDKIHAQILATKSHESSDADTNYLLDADLSILGKTWDAYQIYSRQIRREYSVYPDFLYNPGRKKVLEHFLSFGTIYKTDFFRSKYELRARENMQTELKLY